MALHEETERRALEGELRELEFAWRQAEFVAAISDDLLVPDQVQAQLAQMKQQVDNEAANPHERSRRGARDANGM